MKILITGGCGSLGRAFIRHLDDHELTVIDNDEWAVAECQKEWPKVKFVLDDFVNADLKGVDTLIHLAAYKHINLGEDNPVSFIENNINKTRRLFEKANNAGVDILFVSTDKAVEPCSLYGYTKAIGEKLCRFYGGSVARLGNILSSSGSVIPVWEKALKENKPLPVTDPDMTRYMIHEDDAVMQIWNKFELGDKLIIPDMGKPVKLIHLVQTILKIHNKPFDYPLEIVGRRRGEKVNEKLKWEDE